MSALTGAFEGLGRGISKEADRKLNQWDDERVLAEQEKLIIAREKRVEAAAMERETRQNARANEKSGLLRTQTEADMKQKHEWDVEAAELKASSDQKVAKIKATGGGAAYKLKDRVKFVIVDKYDKDGYVIGQEAKGWDILNQRWLTEDEEIHGISNVASANALAAALVKKKEEAKKAADLAKKAADLAKDKPVGDTTNPVLKTIDPAGSGKPTPGGKLGSKEAAYVAKFAADQAGGLIEQGSNWVADKTSALVEYFFNNPSKQPTTEAQRAAKAEAERQLKRQRRNRTGRGAGSGRV
jgi:hypothetical protein